MDPLPAPRQTADAVVLAVTNAFNLLMVGLFAARALRAAQAERTLGLLCVALILPAAGVVLHNARAGRPAWTWMLLTPLIVFLVAEWVLDYVLASDFRHTPWVWLYVASYFAAQWALIGHQFRCDRRWGYLALATYGLSLIASWWAHSR